MKRQAPTLQNGAPVITQNKGVYCFGGRKAGSRRARAGFSLVEMLVVISIIALVLSVGVATALVMNSKAREVQTREMLQGVLSANDQYKAVRGSGIGLDTSSSDSSAKQYVTACLEVKECEEIMLAALSSSSQAAFERTYTNGSIFDRWGTEVEYRPSNDQTGTGPSTSVANNLLPRSRDPFFASAGPDETWGTDDDITTLGN